MNAMNAPNRGVPTTKIDRAPRDEREHREAEQLALRRLADQVRRLDRELRRERSYAVTRYAG